MRLAPSLDDLDKEWVITNGLGGYSSSTVLGINTRKYHGLLVAPTEPPWKRMLFLSKLEEEVILNGESHPLSSNFYPGLIHPAGYQYLREFVLYPLPTFVYNVRGVEIVKTICMPQGFNAVLVRYSIRAGQELELRVFPLVNCRDIHSLTSAGKLKFECSQHDRGVLLQAYPHEIYLDSDTCTFQLSGLDEKRRWYYNMEYPEEKARGYYWREDHYCPGFFHARVKGEAETHILCTGGWNSRNAWYKISKHPSFYFDSELRRAKELREEHELIPAAKSFIAKTETGAYIIAGYHWFSTWLRDTLISLPGLTLVLGDYLTARDILVTCARMERDGLLPNFLEGEIMNFNSADASLLLFYATHKYLSYTDDTSILKPLLPVLRKIVRAYKEGVGGIKMDRDFLIKSPAGYTWMDARVNGVPVTPRGGKCVEINSLWYSAVRFMEILGEEIFPSSETIRTSFMEAFWDEDLGYLHDVAGDKSLRPNQLLALSLPLAPITERRFAVSILGKIKEKLLTPFGLRTLSPDDPAYKGRYEGDVVQRDLAYHQGTVWPWLLGPYVTALCKYGDTEEAKRTLQPLLSEHLYHAGLGTISEIFDGDPPHTPRGCISQAWSVAEILRCYREDVLGIRPPYEKKYVK